MQVARRLLAILLCSVLIATAQGNTFTKVRYDGGTVSTKTKPDDWDNKLTVTSDVITFKLKDGQTIEIKTRLHFIGLQYTAEGEKKAGLLIQGDKDNYRAIVIALQSVTGQPVAVSEKDREYVPVGVSTTVTKEEETASKPDSSK